MFKRPSVLLKGRKVKEKGKQKVELTGCEI
jgi:hypothetical protein